MTIALGTVALAVVTLLMYRLTRKEKQPGAENPRANGTPEAPFPESPRPGGDLREPAGQDRRWSGALRGRVKTVASVLIVVIALGAVVWKALVGSDPPPAPVDVLRDRLPESLDKRCDFEEVTDEEGVVSGTCSKLPRTRFRFVVDAPEGLDELPDDRYERAQKWFTGLRSGLLACMESEQVSERLEDTAVSRSFCYSHSSKSRRYFEAYSDRYDLYVIVKHGGERGLRRAYQFVATIMFPEDEG